MSLVYIGFVPHPPVLIPEIGRGQENICRETLSAYRELAQRMAGADIETMVVISPHAPLMEEGVTLLNGGVAKGDFSMFGVSSVSLSFSNNSELVKALQEKLPKVILRDGEMDHGAMVPLYFLKKAGWSGKVVIMSMALQSPENYGRMIGSLLRETSERCAILASGDLSHKLMDDGPYGFHPAGPEFDKAVVEGLKKDSTAIREIPQETVEAAGECGYRSLLLALAAMEGSVEVLSYEGPFGVGYLVADLYRSSVFGKWARTCLTDYFDKKETEMPSQGDFQIKRGCFVTLKKNGELRGCIGTTQPWQENLALEIRHNAIAAAIEDPRFWPVEKEELPYIRFSVDILGGLEKIDSPEMLDPWKYGVVVRQGGRTGLLLPHLEGVNTAEEQLRIAKQKAGIADDSGVELWRFEVSRHYE